MYVLRYHPRVGKFLTRIPRRQALKILSKLELLQKDPTSQSLDIKKLINSKQSWRLRVGTIRIIYEIDQNLKRIFINEIGFRGSIY